MIHKPHGVKGLGVDVEFIHCHNSILLAGAFGNSGNGKLKTVKLKMPF